MPSEREVFEKALVKYGPLSQILMTFEEMAELQQALNKFVRKNDGLAEIVKNIAEEIADVEIMLTQMKNLFDIDDMVAAYRENKVERLFLKLEEAADN